MQFNGLAPFAKIVLYRVRLYLVKLILRGIVEKVEIIEELQMVRWLEVGVLGATVSSVLVSKWLLISISRDITSSIMGLAPFTTPCMNSKNPSTSERILSCSHWSRLTCFFIVLTARLYPSSSAYHSNNNSKL
uniref:Uncharacterized protein n=1 Tax=Glossina palpalis gambiensis TaxID=67801 RepID=A0A1B0BV31_9MUSC